MQRWSRQTILPQLGLAGQQRLLDAKVLCIGTGALGSPVTMYLAAAGVGTLVVIDPDDVEISNLQRQILHGESQAGQPKVQSAAARLLDLNPQLRLETHAVLFTPKNAMQLSDGCAAIVDGSDNFPTRFLTNDVAFFRRIPLVHAAIQQFEGQMTVFAPHRHGPCYRCLLPHLPDPGAVPSCAEAGVIGALPGIMGSLQAMETIKLLAEIGEPAIGKMLVYDALAATFRTITLRNDPQCALCGTREITTIDNPETQPQQNCIIQAMKKITVSELRDKLTRAENFTLIDVREPAENAQSAIAGSILIPLASVTTRLNEIPQNQPVIVHCKAGGRSAKACQLLMDQGYTDVTNVTGGMDAWLAEGYPTKA